MATALPELTPIANIEGVGKSPEEFIERVEEIERLLAESKDRVWEKYEQGEG